MIKCYYLPEDIHPMSKRCRSSRRRPILREIQQLLDVKRVQGHSTSLSIHTPDEEGEEEMVMLLRLKGYHAVIVKEHDRKCAKLKRGLAALSTTQ